jgi:hypothetical protein
MPFNGSFLYRSLFQESRGGAKYDDKSYLCRPIGYRLGFFLLDWLILITKLLLFFNLQI